MSDKAFVKLIDDGDSQILCLPKEFEFSNEHVKLVRVGNGVMVVPEDFDVHALNEQLFEAVKN